MFTASSICVLENPLSLENPLFVLESKGTEESQSALLSSKAAESTNVSGSISMASPSSDGFNPLESILLLLVVCYDFIYTNT